MVDLRRVAVVVLSLGSLTLTACGGPPSKADYVDKMRESVGDLDAGLASQNIDPETGDELITRLLECQYESIKDDDDLLTKSYDDPGDPDVTTQLDVKSRACVDEFSTAMAEAAGATPTTALPDVTTTVPGG